VQGTAVAANKRLQALSISPAIKTDYRTFRPVGQKDPSLVTLGKEWVEADLSGEGNYSELQYPLASVVATPTITNVMDAAIDTLARKWVFDSSSVGIDTVKSFTVEQGDTTRAHRFAYGIVSEFGLKFSRDGVESSGMMLGRELQDGVTLTPTPTSIPIVPMLGKQIDVYIDSTSAALGTTKLGRLLSGEFSIGDRFAPLFVVDSANPSWVAHLETERKIELKLRMEADTAGMALLVPARDNTTRFLRLKATGARIYTNGAVIVDHSLSIDVAGKISDVGELSDEDGVFAVEWTFTSVYDAAWTRAFKAELVNLATAL